MTVHHRTLPSEPNNCSEGARLHAPGQKVLADRAPHVSQTKCDMPGCNMRFDASCKERFIEVKTTSFGNETPFIISRNEVEFSRANDAHFHPHFFFPGCSNSARARACSISPGWLRATACSIRFPTLGGSRKREKRLKPLAGAVRRYLLFLRRQRCDKRQRALHPGIHRALRGATRR